jgi:hypothetical protein
MLTGAGATAAAVWVYRDYQKWIDLGPGGLPHNFGGYVTTTRMRLRKIDPLNTTRFGKTARSGRDTGHLGGLPRRKGRRPVIDVHPIPHRQIDQIASAEMKRRIVSTFDAAVERMEEYVEYKLSHFEKRHPAITLKSDIARRGHATASRGEIAHVHPSDGSMHMIFDPCDAVAVIERGWGESHPLAGVAMDLPDTYLLIYPPRDRDELPITSLLLDAAIAHMVQSAAPERLSEEAVSTAPGVFRRRANESEVRHNYEPNAQRSR